jgi:hypothetical protein
MAEILTAHHVGKNPFSIKGEGERRKGETKKRRIRAVCRQIDWKPVPRLNQAEKFFKKNA